MASTNLYETPDQPDARQSEDEIQTSRFRPRYRNLSEDEKALHDEIKIKAEELAQVFERVPEGRYRSLGMTSLELAVMWVVKELTS
jgi:hypothetical protein